MPAWSDELEQRLTWLVEHNVTVSEISRLFGFPQRQVRKKIYLLGIYAGGGDGSSDTNRRNEAAIRAASQRFAQKGATILQQRRAA